MSTAIFISILGAISAILVSVIGAAFTNRNNLVLQTRKLKEDHYVNYIEALHHLAANNEDVDSKNKYVTARDKLFLIASEDVIKKMLLYEEMGVGKINNLHDNYLTELVKSIRKDLKIIDKDFPIIFLKK
jgi:DNA polymerase elongation subunit (family B)